MLLSEELLTSLGVTKTVKCFVKKASNVSSVSEVDKNLMKMFDSTFIESVIPFYIICWYGILSVKNNNYFSISFSLIIIFIIIYLYKWYHQSLHLDGSTGAPNKFLKCPVDITVYCNVL